jgi:hypothetical protein
MERAVSRQLLNKPLGDRPSGLFLPAMRTVDQFQN